MRNLNLKIENNIAILEFDQPGSKANVLNSETMQELDTVIKEIAAKPKSEIKALLITSKKDGIFIAGADIKEIEHITSGEEAKDKAEKGKEILSRLNKLDLITVAVINGACLGGGFELALACKYRLASFSEKVKIGLPEVKLGIIPGFGGTQRLPRVAGIMRALNMILAGAVISGKDALKYGIVDRLFPQAKLLDESLDFAKSFLGGAKVIKKKRKKKLLHIFLENTPLGRAVLFSKAKKNVFKKTKGHYSAPFKALEVIKHTCGRETKNGSLLESEAFAELAITGESKNLIKLFYLNEEFKKLPWIGGEIKPMPVNKCGILGAGVMGGGIAQLVSFCDIPARLKDISYEALKKALQTAYGLFKYALKKKKLRKHDVDYKFGLISPTVTYNGFENAGLVIEAVVENLGIKQNVFKEVSEIVPPQVVIASNTSALPIIKLAEASRHPERVVGLHFFNPVHRMPLVEVIKSDETSDEALATVIAFARRLGKVVILVKDVTGFLINRILLSYMNEAGFLIEEGAKIEHIDKIARDFGMPMGPAELIDEVGIDVGYKVAKILEDAYGARMRVSSLLEDVNRKGLFGKKGKRGFYVHKGKKKKPNNDIYNIVKISGRLQISDEAMLKRMIYLMINEAARCLEEGVADRPQTVDIGMVMGAGFPPFRAGLLRYADSLGTENIVRDLDDFYKKFNSERFKPCNRLIAMAGKKEKFYMEASL